jgi:paraquat-inducible protein B
MSDADPSPHAPHSRVRRSRRISIIWLVPLIAVAIGGWLAYDTWSKQGPTIRVTFNSGEGLQPGQSQLKYKDIVFGQVKRLDLTPDKWHVVVTIETTKEAEPLLTDKAIFWIVRPRLFAGNISGLGTLLSGSFVGIKPDVTGTGTKTTEFVGHEDPPILEEHIAGTIFHLKAPLIGSISAGSPIFFRDIAVGEVLGWDSKDLTESVDIQAFVRAPYDAYVHSETRFWNASGISVDFSGAGVHVQMESLRALLFGGIAFDTPPDQVKAAAAEPEHVFPLFADRDTANSASYTRTVPGIAYFTGSASGLATDSEVTMHGLKIGLVKDVRLKPDLAKGTVVVAVRFEVQPERIVGIGQRMFKTDEQTVAAMLDRGLRASLESASLITGSQMLSLDFEPNAPPVSVTKDGDDFVIPTTESGGFAQLASSATGVLNKINAMPFGQIGANLNGFLGSLNKATEGPQLKEAVDNLATALASAQRTLNNFNKLAQSADKLTTSVDTGYGDDTRFHRDLDRLLVQTDETVRAVRSLADILSRHPEALIRGRPE